MAGVEKFHIKKTVGLKFLLRQMQGHLKEFQPRVHLLQLPDLFQYDSGPDIDLLGQKAEVGQKETDRDHLLHIMKWQLTEKRISILGFGYNVTDWKNLTPSGSGYTMLQIQMGTLEETEELSKFLQNRTYKVLSHRKDIMILGEDGIFYLLDVHNNRISEPNHLDMNVEEELEVGSN